MLDPPGASRRGLSPSRSRMSFPESSAIAIAKRNFALVAAGLVAPGVAWASSPFAAGTTGGAARILPVGR